MSSTPPSWETSKENFQPLRSGRKMSSGRKALSASALDASGAASDADASSSTAVRERISRYESELRLHPAGVEQLAVWHDYIVWVEQTFTKGNGREGNLLKLVQNCIKDLKDAPGCNQDPRYLDVWLKYAAMNAAPLDSYKFMSANGLCTALPDFYVNWAWELERVGNFKKAEAVFQKGLGGAVPAGPDRDALAKKHEHFQARAMKQVAAAVREGAGVVVTSGRSQQVPTAATSDPSHEEERSVLATLKPAKNVGSVRVGAAKKSDAPGTFPVPSTSGQTAGNKRSFQIFKDSSGSGGEKNLTAGSKENLPFGRRQNQENEINPGKWTESKLGGRRTGASAAATSAKAPFSIHEDESSLRTPKSSGKSTALFQPNVLSAKKVSDDDDVPLAIFEPPDPTKRPMYAKHLVYQGATEFSFEELRAIRVTRRMEAERMAEEKVALKRRQDQLREEQEALVQQREEMARQMEELRRMQEEVKQQHMLRTQKPQPTTGVGSNNTSEVEAPSGRKSSLLDDTAALLRASGGGGGAGLVSSQPSPTVNTKEAMALMQNLWGKGRDESVVESHDSPARKKPAFAIYEDEAAEPVPTSEPAATPTAAPAFAIYQDENAGGSTSSSSTSKPPPGQRRRIGLAAPTVDKENMGPPSSQNSADDEDQRTSSFEKMPPPPAPALTLPPAAKSNVNNPNVTMALPSMEDFEEMAKLASTPYFGRRRAGLDDDDDDDDFDKLDENTCAVKIVSKRPKAPVEERPARNMDEVEKEEEDDQLGDLPPSAAPPLPLSPIMETSREYKSSSTSSGHSLMTTQHGMLTKSHWGNTHLGTTTSRTPGAGLSVHHTTATATSSSVRSAGPSTSAHHHKNDMMTSLSGYMADSSSARTPGHVLTKGASSDKGDEDEVDVDLPPPPSAPKPPVRTNPIEEDDDDDDQMTGVINMMAQFKKDTKVAPRIPLSVSAAGRSALLSSSSAGMAIGADVSARGGGGGRRSEFLQESLQATNSFLVDQSAAAVNASVSRLGGMDASGLAVGGRSMLGQSLGPSSMMGQSLLSPSADCSPMAPVADLSRCVRTPSTPSGKHDATPREIEEDLEVSGDLSRLAITTMDMAAVQDPFDEAMQKQLLAQIPQPLWQRHGYHRISGKNVPSIRTHQEVRVGSYDFLIGECKGEGAYGKVFKAMKKEDCGGANETISDMDVVVKVQKPACEWEFYVGTEIHSRLRDAGLAADYGDWFMSIPRCFTFDNGSVLVSEYQQGTLLDVVNAMAKANLKKTLYETVAVYFLIEMLVVAERLKDVEIVHGDIKPDNFLLMRMPNLDTNALDRESVFAHLRPSLQLIDFGRCIDLKMFPRGKTFSHSFAKDKTPEMLEGKPWSYQIDYYGIACCAYVLLSGNYMKLSKNKDGLYAPSEALRRWWNIDLWTSFFDAFLNIPSSTELPDLAAWRVRFEEFFFARKLKTWKELGSLAIQLRS